MTLARVIHASLAPTVSLRDVRLAAALLVRPAAWQNGPHRERLEQELKAHVENASVVALGSGRNALRLVLEALELRRGDAVFLQAYTCVSVPGPVLWVGATPVYVDIRPDTFTMDPDDLRRKLEALPPRSRPRVLIVQHTFGLPADLDQLLEIARAQNLFVIEDCAHALGATYQGRPVGTFGDAAIVSFGRDKVISSVFGGALFVRNAFVAQRLAPRIAALPVPSRWWIAQQLLHPLLATAARETYWAGGRYALRSFQELGVLSKALTAAEKRGGAPSLAPHHLPNALAALARSQFQQLPEFSQQRQTLAKHYTESLRDFSDVRLPEIPPDRTHGFLRYTIRVPNPARLHAAARRAGIILGDWYDTVVAPRDTDLSAVQYRLGSCPHAEEAAQRSVNLPTSPGIGIPEADRVLRSVRKARSLPHWGHANPQ
ncbi:MAG: Pleiotropic regulatory protein [Parcubacteria group bacterium Gr01-1014_38]|nr:MAG: Pleiotropic regulatory protein [Parcubacteria group bacterium Gr01-1014_38]